MSEDQAIYYTNPDGHFLAMIGLFVKSQRMRKNMTQARLSKLANISRSTLSLLENGEGSNLQTLIQVLRMLDALYVFKAFKVEEQISPIAYAKLIKKQRQRASKDNTLTIEEPPLEW